MPRTPSDASEEPLDAASDTLTDEQIWSELSAADEGDDDGAPAAEAVGEPDESAQDEGVPTGGDGSQSPAGTDPAGAEDDIWATATEAQRAALKRMRDEFAATQSERDRLKHEALSNRGRIAAYQRQIAEKSGSNTPSIDDRLKQIVEEYPEVAAPLVDVIKEVREDLSRIKSSEQDSAVIEMEQRVQKRHPNYSNFVAQRLDDYREFLDVAPPFMRDIAERNDATVYDDRELNLLLDSFKGYLASKQQPTPTPQPNQGRTVQPSPQQGRRQRQIVSAAAPNHQSRSPSAQADGGPAQGSPDSDWEYWRQFDARRGA